ncbi:Uncharacterised protein [Mycobacteroides abscessus]|nr:Uncharacterised protein [Mycobacteroides abscessus]
MTRNICTGHASDVASSTACGGSSRTASLWPTYASNASGRPASSGSARPSGVSRIVTGEIGSAYVSSSTAPSCRPRVPTP